MPRSARRARAHLVHKTTEGSESSEEQRKKTMSQQQQQHQRRSGTAAAMPRSSRRRRQSSRSSPRGAALAAFLLTAISSDAFSTGPQPTASATARIRNTLAGSSSRTAQHSQHHSSSSVPPAHPKSSLATAVAEPRTAAPPAGEAAAAAEGRNGRGGRTSASAGIKRRSSICGSESRAHRSNGSIGAINYVDVLSSRTSSRPAAPKSKARQASSSSAAVARSRRMPPWLSAPTPPPTRGSVRDKLFALRRSMSEHSHLSSAEVHAVSHSLEVASRGSLTHLSGAIDFLDILVDTMEMGRDALIAAAFHYCGCVRAREVAAEAEERGEGGRSVVTGMALLNHHPSLSSSSLEGGVGGSTRLLAGEAEFDAAYLCTLAGSGIESYGPSVAKIAMDAMRLKGTEAVAEAVSEARTSGGGGGKGKNRRMTREEADNLRSLLLSNNASGEWRALAIRCAACLYRLRGLRNHRASHPREYDGNSPSGEEITAGREALHIYAPLAHRLGMHKLKSELEGAAFKALYKRQHRAVTSLLHRNSDGRRVNARGIPVPDKRRKVLRKNKDKNGGGSPFFFADSAHEAPPTKSRAHQAHQDDREEEDGDDSVRSGMRSVLEDITYQVKRMLHEDSHLMEHVETVKVAARVKEPYSLWRKLLKTHGKKIQEAREEAASSGEKNEDVIRPLSVLDVYDAIALRVIVSARKLSPTETDGETSSREHDLCYHVQHLCSSELGPPLRRVKDYVRHPKPNGYQSLHYSTKRRWHGEDWPFEVQIRSGDMHRVAEFGLAAHWEYKARSAKAASSSSVETPRPLYDAEDGYLKSVADWSQGGSRRAKESSSEPQPLSAADYAALECPDHEGHGRERRSQEHGTGTGAGTASYDSLLFATVAESDPHGYTRALRSERARRRAERLAPYIEALSAAGTDLARERVFVFLNAGGSGYGGESIVSLPAGSNVLDALREEERRTGTALGLLTGGGGGGGSDAGDESRRRRQTSSFGGIPTAEERLSVLRNGSLTGMNQRLENGDVLTFFAPPAASSGAGNNSGGGGAR